VVPLALNLAIVVLSPSSLLDCSRPSDLLGSIPLPYFWYSIDATQTTWSSAETYNIVDTLAYALILVPSLLFIWRVLDAIQVKVDTHLS